jgi:hypothetical protein
MATIINNPNNPGPDRVIQEDSSAGIIAGLIVAVLLIVLVLIFAAPYINNSSTPTAPNTGGNPTITPKPGTSGSVNVQINPSPSPSSGTSY